jgi:hypothetical protein
MVEFGGGQRFTLKALFCRGMNMWQQYFDGNGTPQAHVGSPINGGSCTFTDQLFDKIPVSQFLTDHDILSGQYSTL